MKRLAAALAVALLAGCGGSIPGGNTGAFEGGVAAQGGQNTGVTADGKLSDPACMQVFFQYIDKNRNGHVSKEELTNSTFGDWAPPHKIFEFTDTDRNSQLSLTEMYEDYKKQYAHQRAFFVVTDISDDDRVTEREAVTSPLWDPFNLSQEERERYAQGLVNGRDANKNGSLNWTEFKSVFGWSIGCYVQGDSTTKAELSYKVAGQQPVVKAFSL